MTMPMEGIRVLDLSRVMAGPFCGQLLADFGAEVIKIEDPRGGDSARSQPPFIKGTGSIFYVLNRNKKSLTLDLKKEEGKEILRRLVRESDVLIEQFRPGVMDRLGLGYGILSDINPGLVYCALTGYGQTGPMSSFPSHDLNYQSLSGVALHYRRPGEKPLLPPIGWMALAGGTLYAAIAIMMALYQRNKTGRGQMCDVAILDGAVSLIAQLLAERAGWGDLPHPGKLLFCGGFASYNIYPTSDRKYVALATGERKFWEEFCVKIGRPELGIAQWDPNRQEEIIEAVTDFFMTRTAREWEEHFYGSNICVTPLLDVDEVCIHPQIISRDMITRLADFVKPGEDLCLGGVPFKLSETPGQLKAKFPELGQDNGEILKYLGYGNEEIASLHDKGII